MERIAVDMDEVIADFMSKFVMLFNKEYGVKLSVSDFRGKQLNELGPLVSEAVENFLNKPDYFRDLPVMENSREVIKELSNYYEIYITSAAMEFPTSFTAKYEWLKENFGFLSDLNFVFCGDKSILNADFLIDDNIRHFERFSGQGILFTAPHNINETGFVRVGNWLEVKKYFLETRRGAAEIHQ